MQLQAAQNTAPEIELRRELHRLGLRYRLHLQVLPDRRRRVDIAFLSARVAVDVRGCFWHACPDHGVWPKANKEWWERKLTRNQQRDRETEHLLAQEGWCVVVVWEHENMESAARAIAELVRSRRRLPQA